MKVACCKKKTVAFIHTIYSLIRALCAYLFIILYPLELSLDPKQLMKPADQDSHCFSVIQVIHINNELLDN